MSDKFDHLFHVSAGRNRQRAVKYHIVRRQMTPPGPPQRKLTWDAIEQIRWECSVLPVQKAFLYNHPFKQSSCIFFFRYLKREQPEEWTVDRLAEGFSVTPEVIFRVLRSKFTPSSDRKAKQDVKVMAKHNQQVLPSGAETQQGKLKLPGGHTQAILPSGNKEVALISVTGQAQLIQGECSDCSGKSLTSVTVPTTRQTRERCEDATLIRSTTNEDITAGNQLTESLEEEESWDGQVLTEKELEEFMEMDKPPPAVQAGNEFFDEEGNFLYRLWERLVLRCGMSVKIFISCVFLHWFLLSYMITSHEQMLKLIEIFNFFFSNEKH